jgi:peroxiredoxin
MRQDNVYELPPNLPVPQDDGACDHLAGLPVPSVRLRSTAGREIDLRELATSRTVLYIYPRSGRPDEALPPGWNEVPGARGCTPQSCAYRDHYEELRRLGVRVFGMSTQTTDAQQEFVRRVGLPFEVLSDADRGLTRALKLPTFDVPGHTCIKRLTLVLSQGRIEKVFYPVFPPDKNAEEVIAWLRQNPA